MFCHCALFVSLNWLKKDVVSCIVTEYFLQRLQSYYRAADWTLVDVLCWALGRGEEEEEEEEKWSWERMGGLGVKDGEEKQVAPRHTNFITVLSHRQRLELHVFCHVPSPQSSFYQTPLTSVQTHTHARITLLTEVVIALSCGCQCQRISTCLERRMWRRWFVLSVTTPCLGDPRVWDRTILQEQKVATPPG